jgi:hypothetical protein
MICEDFLKIVFHFLNFQDLYTFTLTPVVLLIMSLPFTAEKHKQRKKEVEFMNSATQPD